MRKSIVSKFSQARGSYESVDKRPGGGKAKIGNPYLKNTIADITSQMKRTVFPVIIILWRWVAVMFSIILCTCVGVIVFSQIGDGIFGEVIKTIHPHLIIVECEVARFFQLPVLLNMVNRA